MTDIDTIVPHTIDLSETERELLRTALRLLISMLGRDEADELRTAQVLLARLERAQPAGT